MVYEGEKLKNIAFPMGGMGAGMICLEGTGALSHFSLRSKPDINNEPIIFSAINIKGETNEARVLEGPVPDWKIFHQNMAGNGLHGKSYGLPRFSYSSFKAMFPFGMVTLKDKKIPLKVEITGWSPFIPNDADNSSLPVAGLEYRFVNISENTVNAVFSFNSSNFMSVGVGECPVESTYGGFILKQQYPDAKPFEQETFCAMSDDPNAKINCRWFRGGWFDSLTTLWKLIEEGRAVESEPYTEGLASPGGSIFVLFELMPGDEKTIRVMLSWYVPHPDLKYGKAEVNGSEYSGEGCCCKEKKAQKTYKPWYSASFKDIKEVSEYWETNYYNLKDRTLKFTNCFFDSSLPKEIIEAVAANLTILKSPSVLRQVDGRLWCWEGCCDTEGCCEGSCTHVWNYAQAIPHLFHELERGLRQTEFNECQDNKGHQMFRSSLPIRPLVHDFHAAADGQLGGIMKVYREWRISGNTEWMKIMWPKVKKSLEYCINTWDPDRKGILEEPHHNTYDIEFWGPDGMCCSIYLGALKAAGEMAAEVGENPSTYREIYKNGRIFMEHELFNGEYFEQKIMLHGLKAEKLIAKLGMTPEELELIRQEGPKYQYGKGCLADGVIGAWMAFVCGIGEILDREKVISHLKSIFKHNFKRDLSEHVNSQRPGYAIGSEGGLLLCTWPKGGHLTLPFVYSNEVWTGIEYQVASHMMSMGLVEEGLEIVRTCRARYDGLLRNPFDEYECGHWYARAMASYALLQGITGIRYDAVEKKLFMGSRIKKDFRSFISTATGYGIAGVKDEKPFVTVVEGSIDVDEISFSL